MAPPHREEGAIIIGLDFGTTFTGVAYDYVKADKGNSNDIEPLSITLWPSSGYGDFPKVPSALVYRPDGTVAWGHQASDDSDAILWFKLLLLDEDDLPLHLGSAKQVMQASIGVAKTDKDVVAIIAEYLSKVWEHALDVIGKARGKKFIDTHPILVMATVPAMWQDYAVANMEHALRMSGILNQRPGCPEITHAIVSEPEAAALATIHHHQKFDTLQCGQTFVIADLGGGTVDLVSFTVQAIHPRLVLEEVVEGEGALCGATFLDEAFRQCVQAKMNHQKSKDRTLKSWDQLHELEQKRILHLSWERGIKRNHCDGNEAQRIDLGTQGNRRPDVLLESSDLNNIFDSVYEEISRLVDRQVKAIEDKTGDVPSFIALSGGFGRCPYIYHELRREYQDQIEILFEQDEKPWTAVSRGAVLAGAARLNDQTQVQSHISRYSYGWNMWEDFDSRVHHPDDRATDTLTGRRVASDQIQWCIHRGESVKAQSFSYERYFEIEEVGLVTFSEPIYRSSLSKPPTRLIENEREAESSQGASSANFRQHATIQMQTPVPVEQLPRGGRTRYPHRILNYTVEVNVSGANLTIQVMSHGKKIGHKTISTVSD
ncbi:hypothetical protein F4808DRAFT_467844 [Astrocystis sublimbata]|nr:hypothetical protein F4808DRAFT_467844 [Astrocystis sublimbata]